MSNLKMICDTIGGRIMIALNLLLVIGQMTVLIQAVLQRRKAGVILLTALHFLLGTALLILLLSGLDYGGQKPVPPSYAEWVYRLPWIFLPAAEILSACLLLVCLYSGRMYRRTHLTASAVKETVDLLETGICFGTPDGVALLTNVRMNEYCQALTGRILTDTRVLWEKVLQGGKRSGKQYLVPLPDRRMVMFGKTAVTLDGVSCEQIIAADMTEQYRIIAELKEKNKRLREHQLRLKMLMAQNAALIPSQEILAARTAFHDQFGGLLLMGKYCFEHPDSADLDALLKLVRQTNSLLLEQVERPDDARSPYEEAQRLCDRIGVHLDVQGNLPTERAILNILGHAMIECASNAVKHAEGHALTVRCSRNAAAFTAVFTNDGTPPARPIQESGGLLSLRRMTENQGGQMNVECSPVFRLALIFPFLS